MASNSHHGKCRLDQELEKYRLELNWTKIIDKLKTNKESDYGKFLEGEAKLELYFQQYPLIDKHSNENIQKNFPRIENLLKKTRSFDSFCLLAKLCYGQLNDEECWNYLNSAFNSIPNEMSEQPHRSSLLLAEIYSLQAILLEKRSENLLEIIQSFHNSCQLSQKYYSAMEKAKDLNHDNLDIENSLIEIAYQRLPLLHVLNNNLVKAIEIFRSSIENVHIKCLETMRQTLIKQFAQLLIKCVCQSNYVPINMSKDLQEQHQHFRRRHSQSLFLPENVDEEICLLLLLGQNCTLNEAVLDWQPEYEKQRERSHQAAYHILSLLAIFLSRKQAFHLIVDSYEQALRFSFEHFQSWYNYGLSLISSGQSFRAYLILKECLRMKPKKIQVYLQLAKIILQNIYHLSSLFETFPSSGEDARPLFQQEQFHQYYLLNGNQYEQRPSFLQLIDESIVYCEQARDLENPPLARSILLLGLAKSFKARQTSIHQDRQTLFQSAIHEFRQYV